MAGFTANIAARGAICMTSHNGRRGLRDDNPGDFTPSDATRAPHEGPQADVLMGQNLYLTKVGTPGFHSMVEDSCVNCHMEKTTAPAAVSLPGVGTNHTFYADRTICSKCHSNITADSVQGPVLSKMDTLKGEIQKAINAAVANPAAGGGTAIGGGAGNGAGAVSCTSPYVYWAEAVGHAAGVGGSQWRTDLVARNLAAGNASLKFVFHQAGGNLEGTN